jgi:glycosyltransferase 2 family protein
VSAPSRGEAWKRAGRWAIPIPLAAVLLYYSLRGVEWAGIWSIIAAARWEYIAAACAITAFNLLLRSLRWRILLNAEAHLSLGLVFRANMAGYLGNNFLPARAGEVIRSLIVSAHSTLSKTYALTTALSERLMDVIALVLWSSLVLLGVHPKPAWMEGLSRSMAAVAAAGALTVAILPHTGDLLENLLRRAPLPAALRGRLLPLAGQILLGLRAFHHWGRFGGFALFTAAIWTLDASGAMIASRAFGMNLSFSISMLLITAMGLGSALPSTPGYLGIYQFVAVTVLTPFGIARDAAVAYIMVMQAVGYAVVLILGLPCLPSLRRARRAAETPLMPRLE